MRQSIQEWTKYILRKTSIFFGRDVVSLSRPYPFKFFKGCFAQNLLSPLLNTLFHITREGMDGCNCSIEKTTPHERMNGSTWSSKRTQLIKWMTSRNSPLQIQYDTTLKNRRPQLVFLKKYFVLAANDVLKIIYSP